jgi:hypothetical protein
MSKQPPAPTLVPPTIERMSPITFSGVRLLADMIRTKSSFSRPPHKASLAADQSFMEVRGSSGRQTAGGKPSEVGHMNQR